MSKQQLYNLNELSDSNRSHGSKALEMIMRDVIDGMEDIANLAGYSPQPGSCFEVLEIIPAASTTADPQQDQPSAEIILITKKPTQTTA